MPYAYATSSMCNTSSSYLGIVRAHSPTSAIPALPQACTLRFITAIQTCTLRHMCSSLSPGPLGTDFCPWPLCLHNNPYTVPPWITPHPDTLALSELIPQSPKSLRALCLPPTCTLRSIFCFLPPGALNAALPVAPLPATNTLTS